MAQEFDAKRLAGQLKEVSGQYMHDAAQRWLQAGAVADIFIWYTSPDKQQVKALQFVVNGEVVHINEKEGIRTGSLTESPQRSAYGGTQDEMFIKFSRYPDVAQVQALSNLLEYAAFEDAKTVQNFVHEMVEKQKRERLQ